MNVDWNKGAGLVPAIIQDATEGRVLMLGYMNEESLRLTRETGKVTFYSRSRSKLWVKGETSGDFLDFVSAELDCDGDTLLVKARPHGAVCHTGTATCFGDKSTAGFLGKLSDIIDARFAQPNADESYVAKLIARGEDRIIQKVGEEAVETVIAAKGNDVPSLEGEAADLLFHLMVLLRAKGTSLANVTRVLEKRHGSRSESER